MPRSSRDDFPVNAFALLPASVLSDSGVSDEQNEPSSGSKDPREDELRAVEVTATTSSENPMTLLKLNLAHTELRDTVELLYRAIHSLESENGALMRENARLSEAEKRAKTQVKTTEEKAREKLQAYERENLQLGQRVRELEKNEERYRSEMAELEVKLSERDTVIATLQNRIQDLEEEQHRANDVVRQEMEVRQLVELWSSKERSVAENTSHLREATSAVQRLSEHLQSQLQEVKTTLISTEEEYDNFRTYLAEHECNKNPRFFPANHGQLPTEDILKLQNQAREGEQRQLEQSTEIHTLQTRCREYEKSIKVLRSQLGREREKNELNKSLIAKYEASASDGTQTIAELQESLMKLCNQLAQERKEFGAQLSELIRTSASEKGSMELTIIDLGNQLRKKSQDVEDAKISASSRPCELCNDRMAAEMAQQSKKVPEEVSPASITCSPVPTPRQGGQTSWEDHGKSGLNLPMRTEIEDVIENSDSDLDTKSKNLIGRSTSHNRVAGKTPGSCRLCNEEPFGFMVRCQKCKDAFHAGCAKNSIPGTKKRLGHIFKCNNCVPQRPAKVQRSGADRDVSKNAEESAPQPRNQPSALVVTPSRSVVVARPTTSETD